jgi:polyferredoxin
MKAVAYRRFRIAVGAGILVFSVLAFANVGGWIPASIARVGMWPQFAPSLLAAWQGVTWISAAFLVVLVMTLLCGRVYCAMLCPLGVLMDLSAWLARRTGKKRKLAFREGVSGLRVAVVIVCVGGLVAGLALPLVFLDPYSVFGKITVATVRPLTGMANNLLSFAGWVPPVKWSPVDPVTLVIALALLVVVVVLAVTRGRLWCNTLCPVGAVLGFISRHALFRLRIADSDCIGCSQCERVCPAQCIDFRSHRIDHSRCVMCLDCVTACARSGIHLRYSPFLETSRGAEAGDGRSRSPGHRPTTVSIRGGGVSGTGTG